jgi:Zn finger protein HypA/HybF involved in hydrogenase expression
MKINSKVTVGSDTPIKPFPRKTWTYKCRNPKCEHEWKVKGVSPMECPKCHSYNFHLIIKEVSKGEDSNATYSGS